MATTTTKRPNRRPAQHPENLTCRAPAGTLARIAEAAEREGTWPSEWMRAALLAALVRSERRAARREEAGE